MTTTTSRPVPFRYLPRNATMGQVVNFLAQDVAVEAARVGETWRDLIAFDSPETQYRYTYAVERLEAARARLAHAQEQHRALRAR